jgi:hypothetical protein
MTADPHWDSTTITRAQNRAASMAKPNSITNAYEIDVEDRFRTHLLALPPGTRIIEGWSHICGWLTKTFDVKNGDETSLHSHLTVLLMAVVGKLCKTGFLEPLLPDAPEHEFTRTRKGL